MRGILFCCLILVNLQSLAQSRYRKDFDFYWQTIKENYAYFDKQVTDWNKVKTIYQPISDTISSTNSFVRFLEIVNNELYNGHIFLNTNTSSSNRTIPTGSDLKASWINKQYIITEVREGYNADLAGMKAGMRISKFNGIPVHEAVRIFLPRSTNQNDRRIHEYAVNMLLAGTHDKPRQITVIDNGKEVNFEPDRIPNKTESSDTILLQSSILSGNVGYIKINNSLGENSMIAAFDKALDKLMGTEGLLLDLRETPSGGNTTVARAIMGRFIDHEMPYQKHIYTAEQRQTGVVRSNVELVSPRGGLYKKPLIVLVGNWTGSMGEGIAIGFDAMKRATIAGTKMAGLLGEIFTFRMPETKIPFSFPAVQLQHVNGQPREDFVPTMQVQDAKQTLPTALAAIKRMNR